jgi:hypothetical protein
MRLDEGSKIANITKVAREDEMDDDLVESAPKSENSEIVDVSDKDDIIIEDVAIEEAADESDEA